MLNKILKNKAGLAGISSSIIRGFLFLSCFVFRGVFNLVYLVAILFKLFLFNSSFISVDFCIGDILVQNNN